MDNPVSLRRDGNVAIITIDNPPVNALRHGVRKGILESVIAARDDASVEAIVLTGAGRTFVAGADITEFGKPPQPPSLIEVIAMLDDVKKPTIAAVHGTPLGGGLELTLGCHFRVAAAGTRLGLPEIKLGLIPGAGGTQRLPRLVGIEKALPMILSGDPIPAKDALAAGLVDEIIEGDLVAGAVAFARKVLAEKRPLHARARTARTSSRTIRANPAKFDEIVAQHAKKTRGLHAPAAAIEAIKLTLDTPIDEAQKKERDAVHEARRRRSVEGAAPHLLRRARGRQGPGHRQGRAAARDQARRGDRRRHHGRRHLDELRQCRHSGDDHREQRGRAQARHGDDRARTTRPRCSAARSSPRTCRSASRCSRRPPTSNALKDADIVIEAVFEEMPIKKELFGKLEKIAKPGAVLATNTSYLNVDEIARVTSRVPDVLGMHFFSPANVMRLLEIVRGKDTAPDVLATAMAVGRKISKVPVVVGVCHGFVGNRMLSRARDRGGEAAARRRAAAGRRRRAHRVRLPDGAVRDGRPRRPRRRLAHRARSAACATRSPTRSAEQGRFGQKTGKGFYLYEGALARAPDPEVEKLIVDASVRLGVKRRTVSKEEIIERLIYPMVNEGARILEEGIATRPGDIDVIWLYGYGFPAWRGGPMHWADTVGLTKIRDRLRELAKETGDKRHEPAALLEQARRRGRHLRGPRRPRRRRNDFIQGATACPRPSSYPPPARRSARRSAARST